MTKNVLILGRPYEHRGNIEIGETGVVARGYITLVGSRNVSELRFDINRHSNSYVFSTVPTEGECLRPQTTDYNFRELTNNSRGLKIILDEITCEEPIVESIRVLRQAVRRVTSINTSYSFLVFAKDKA